MLQITSLFSGDSVLTETKLTPGNAPAFSEGDVINVFSDIHAQRILGFGGAFTESSAYNFALLSDSQKADFLRACFDKKDGLGYTFGRTHINSCDFSLGMYTYVEDGDKLLTSFSIDREKTYTLPLIRAALEKAGDITLFATPWSPPAYMKDNASMIRGGKLLPEYKETWAHYYARYIKAMEKEGVHISAVSIQNEPLARQPWESCNYSDEDEAEFLNDYLLPALDAEGLSEVKVILWDHNKERVFDRSRNILSRTERTDRVLAAGHHWYTGSHYEGIRLANEVLGVPTICTEFCCTIREDVVDAAEQYACEILNDLDAGDIAICDWNLLLDTNGGPFHNRSEKTVYTPGSPVFEDKSAGCYAPILFDTESKELCYTPIYYAIRHFSRYIKKDAVRVAATTCDTRLPAVAFENPDGTLATVVLNTTDTARNIVLRIDGDCTFASLPAHSISTVLL